MLGSTLASHVRRVLRVCKEFPAFFPLLSQVGTIHSQKLARQERRGGGVEAIPLSGEKEWDE